MSNKQIRTVGLFTIPRKTDLLAGGSPIPVVEKADLLKGSFIVGFFAPEEAKGQTIHYEILLQLCTKSCKNLRVLSSVKEVFNAGQ